MQFPDWRWFIYSSGGGEIINLRYVSGVGGRDEMGGASVTTLHQSTDKRVVVCRTRASLATPVSLGDGGEGSGGGGGGPQGAVVTDVSLMWGGRRSDRQADALAWALNGTDRKAHLLCCYSIWQTDWERGWGVRGQWSRGVRVVNWKWETYQAKPSWVYLAGRLLYWKRLSSLPFWMMHPELNITINTIRCSSHLHIIDC